MHRKSKTLRNNRLMDLICTGHWHKTGYSQAGCRTQC